MGLQFIPKDKSMVNYLKNSLILSITLKLFRVLGLNYAKIHCSGGKKYKKKIFMFVKCEMRVGSCREEGVGVKKLFGSFESREKLRNDLAQSRKIIARRGYEPCRVFRRVAVHNCRI